MQILLCLLPVCLNYSFEPERTSQCLPSTLQANINGRVLSQCNLDELKKEMEMNFGDWQLFRGMVGLNLSCGQGCN